MLGMSLSSNIYYISLLIITILSPRSISSKFDLKYLNLFSTNFSKVLSLKNGNYNHL